MPSLSLAWRAADTAGELIAVMDGQARAPFFETISAQTFLMIVRPTASGGTPDTQADSARVGPGVAACLDLLLVPAEQRLIARAGNDLVHFLRLADATLKSLEPEPGPINLAPGDAYVALIAGQPPLTPGARLATARFIHLRDYFNADKLAVDLLKHLHGDDGPAGQTPPALGTLVIECR